MAGRSKRRYTVTGKNNEATLTLGDGQIIEYWAPWGGGYVRRVTWDRPGTLGQQICDGLTEGGPTLYWRGRESLATLIRREARSAKGSRTIDYMLELGPWD